MGALPHERGQGLHNRPIIGFAFLRDALQRVDSPETQFEFVARELLRGLAEAFGDAALLIRFCLLLMTVARGRCLSE